MADERPFTPAVTNCEAAESHPPASGAVLDTGRNSLSSVKFYWDAPDANLINSSTPQGSHHPVFQYISFL